MRIVTFTHLDQMSPCLNFIWYFPVVSLLALVIGFLSFNLIETDLSPKERENDVI